MNDMLWADCVELGKRYGFYPIGSPEGESVEWYECREDALVDLIHHCLSDRPDPLKIAFKNRNQKAQQWLDNAKAIDDLNAAQTKSYADAAAGPKIKPGDVVMLKSGGPKMTVNSVKDERASCVWHMDDINHAEFATDALTAA